MNERGFTIIEIFMVFLLIGAMVAFGIPRISQTLNKGNVRSARDAVATLHARARASAIQRGLSVTLLRSGTTVLVRQRHAVTGVLDTLDTPTDIYDRYGGVAMTWSADSLMFDSRGIGQQSGTTTIVFSKSGYADTLQISAAGAVLQ